VILKLLGLVMPLRGDAREESLGMDIVEHGEEAYLNGEGAILILEDGDDAAFQSPRVASGRR
jgi:Amt family ammonium transporter